jgi:hypothetical protein
MRVESETGSGAIIDAANDIRAPIRHGTNLSGEAGSREVGCEKRGGLDLPSGRVLRVDCDEPLKEASEASDVRSGREGRKAHCTFPLAATT